MEFVVSFLNMALPLLYFCATALYGIYFFRDERWAEKIMSNFLKFTVLVHFLDVLLRVFVYSHFPLASIFEAAMIISLAVGLVYIYIEYKINVKSTGFFVLIFIFILQFFSSAFIFHVYKIPEILHSIFFVFHTSSAILGYSAFAISALYSLMYLMLFHEIKAGHFGVIYRRMPSLSILSEMNNKAARIGLFFLTLAIILGSIWSSTIFKKFINLDPKIIVAYLTWVIYSVQVFGSMIKEWSGKRLSMISLAGFAIIVFSMALVNTILTSFHEFK